MNTRISSQQLSQRIATDIIRQQSQLTSVQEQITTGRRINRPSDDPAQAGRLLGMEEASSQLTQFNRNASTAEARLSLEETTINGVSNALMRVRELALSANSGAVDEQTRSALAAEVEQKLGELYDLANVRDPLGGYLFAGSNSATQPFTRQVPVNYHGNDDTQRLPVGLGRTVETGDSGADVFMRIRNGNGRFQVSADSTNTGSGVIAPGSVSNQAAYSEQAFRLEFTTSSSYNVIEAVSGTVVQPNVPFAANSAIEFNGISTSITGQPATGDVFQLQPSVQQDLFTTVANFSGLLGTNPGTAAEKAQFQQNVDATLASLDQALEHVNTTRSTIGARLNSIDSSRDENDSINIQLELTQAEIEDVDIADAVTQLQSRITSLEILQKSYARVEGLSLFNYM